MDPSLVFRVLVVAGGFEPAFFTHVDPLKGPLDAQVKKHVIAGIPLKNTVRGRVIDPYGRPLAQAVVSVGTVRNGELSTDTSPDGTDPLAITDDHGNFEIYSRQAFDSLSVTVIGRGMSPQRFDNLKGGVMRHTLRITPGGSLNRPVFIPQLPLAVRANPRLVRRMGPAARIMAPRRFIYRQY